MKIPEKVGGAAKNVRGVLREILVAMPSTENREMEVRQFEAVAKN